ncbi:MAG TPA: amidohydrolase family protein [Chthoniobacteraceae bacterium]
MKRRTFLRRAAIAAGAAIAKPSWSAMPDAAVPAIDTHIHLYDPTRPQGVPWPQKNETLLYQPHLPPQFREIAAQNGVVGAIVIEASAWLEDNQWVLDLIKDDLLFVGFIGHLELGRSEFAANLGRFVVNPLFRGLRIEAKALADGLGKRAWEDDIRRLADANLTVDLLGDPAMLPNAVKLARLAPTLRIVVDHLPFPAWDKDLEAAKTALTSLVETANVFVKVSAVARAKEGKLIEDPAVYRPGLELLWSTLGDDRLIYGSNWPVSDLVAPYAFVHKIVADYFATKSSAAAEMFFWRNSKNAYGWIPRGDAAKLG